MPRKAAIVINAAEGLCGCGCGCGERVASGRRFRQGHDARLRGKLAQAARDGNPVAIQDGESKTTKPAAEWLRLHNWPIPEPKAPKAKATAST